MRVVILSRLVGSPPGYVGFEEGGQLVKDVRKNPRAVILFDEIEKANEDIYNVLLQVMDYGQLTDNQGRKADFRSCIIIMTSNAGARDLEKGSIGFGGDTATDIQASLTDAVNRSSHRSSETVSMQLFLSTILILKLQNRYAARKLPVSHFA